MIYAFFIFLILVTLFIASEDDGKCYSKLMIIIDNASSLKLKKVLWALVASPNVALTNQRIDIRMDSLKVCYITCSHSLDDKSASMDNQAEEDVNSNLNDSLSFSLVSNVSC